VLAVVYEDYQLVKPIIVSQSHGIPITAGITAEINTGCGLWWVRGPQSQCFPCL